MGDGFMWGENFVASIQDVIRANPYLSYVANLERPYKSPERVEEAAEKREEIILSREVLDVAPAAKEEADERPHDGEEESSKSDDELLEEIDRKVTELLAHLLMNQDYALIVLENFNRTRDLCCRNQLSAEYASQSRLSLSVLDLLSQEERLPGEFRQAFRILFREYRAIGHHSLDSQSE
jgi:hypothetical protein